MGKTPSKLIEIATRHQAFLEGHKTHIVNSYGSFLEKQAKTLRTRLKNKDLTAYSSKRFEVLLKQVDGDLKDLYKSFSGVWREQIVDLANYEAGFEVRSMSQVIDNYDFNLPSRTQLKSAVFGKPLASIEGAYKGQFINDLISGWSSKSIQAVEGAIRGGYYQGLTTSNIVKQIRGTVAEGFRNGTLGASNKELTLLTRTVVQHAANEARNDTWKANSDLITGVRIIATLDDRTSDICQNYDGEVFPVDSGPRPPFHPGCRSSTVPEFDGRFSALEEGATRRERDPETGKVGDVPAKQTYYEWLKKQKPEFQNEIIGPTRARLLRDGGLSATRFKELGMGKNFQPLTLKEMYKKEPLVFERAGFDINDKGNVIKK